MVLGRARVTGKKVATVVLSLGLLGPQESLEIGVAVVLGDPGVSGSLGESIGNGAVGGRIGVLAVLSFLRKGNRSGREGEGLYPWGPWIHLGPLAQELLQMGVVLVWVNPDVPGRG